MRLIMIGPQGSGKGTQAKMLSGKLNIPHISTGQIFRDNIKNKTPLGLQVEKYVNNGGMVPNSITNEIIKERLSHDDCKGGFILDGYPRDLGQAENLENYAPVNFVLDIEISDEESIQRISGRRVCQDCGENFHILFKKPNNEEICDACGGVLIQRDDDAPEAILKRLQIYHEATEPVKAFYQDLGRLIVIDGSPSIEEVFTEIMQKLPL